ncbi:SEC-C metal-binding domain-containing protein [Sciscionella marina]|uniref:SEC-C metal-binding domain-containing protein n=1 Tax=Sciscionella marina TaxID=508770 RepID=UPI00035D7D32|nr:SEC-C metal-binding domain-containing protein [Sciscionella marina]
MREVRANVENHPEEWGEILLEAAEYFHILEEYEQAVELLGEVIAWPPERNEACRCGSGTKYRKCCGCPGLP